MCHCQLIKVELIDQKSAMITCPVHGSSYLHYGPKGWERKEERMERMKRVHTCSCGRVFHDFKTYKRDEGAQCDTCQEKYSVSERDELDIKQGMGSRDNKHSPWRVFSIKKMVHECR